MNFLKLPCAGKLGNCPENLRRFHLTCLTCRSRRREYNGWTAPPHWISYTIPWLVQYFVLTNRETGEAYAVKEKWQTLKIDPRGHFTFLRCAIIITFLKVAGKIYNPRFDMAAAKAKRLFQPRLSQRLVTLCEFVANITI